MNDKAEILLPNTCTEADLCTLLAEVLGDATICFQKHTFLKPPSLALLAAWALARKAAGAHITIQGEASRTRYLMRMGFGCIAEIDGPTFRSHSEKGRFTPLQFVGPKEDHQSVKEAVDALCDLFVRNFDDNKSFLPAFEWAAQEIVDNAITHGAAQTPAIACGQVYPNERKVVIAICDTGIGFRASLASRHAPPNDEAAICLATQRGITRDPAYGQGNGLAGAALISQRNGGSLQIRSGTSLVEFRGPYASRNVASLPGTTVSMELRTDVPVPLESTWIEATTGTLYFQAERERLTGLGFIVRKECAHFGGRPPAEQLRRKVASVIDDSVFDGTPIRLDFQGVENPSSSFLDEVVGKLVQQYGVPGFKQRIQLVSASQSTRARLNVVVGQRLKEMALSKKNG